MDGGQGQGPRRGARGKGEGPGSLLAKERTGCSATVVVYPRGSHTGRAGGWVSAASGVGDQMLLLLPLQRYGRWRTLLDDVTGWLQARNVG